MFYSAGYGSGYNERKAQIEASHYASDTPKQIERECSAKTGKAARECIAEIVKAERESQRSESDLAAQWKAADWVLWAGVIAGAQLIATVIGLYYVKGTLDETRRAVNETEGATNAMREANEIAATANRPYLIVEPELEKSTMYQPGKRVEFIYRNYGNSPARLIRHFFALVEKADGQEIEKAFSDRLPGKSFPDGMIIGYGERSSRFFADAEGIVIGGPALSFDFIEQSYSVWKDAYFFGCVVYADIGGNHWCRRFCWTIENNSVDLQETDPARNSEYRSDKDGNPI